MNKFPATLSSPFSISFSKTKRAPSSPLHLMYVPPSSLFFLPPPSLLPLFPLSLPPTSSLLSFSNPFFYHFPHNSLFSFPLHSPSHSLGLIGGLPIGRANGINSQPLVDSLQFIFLFLLSGEFEKLEFSPLLLPIYHLHTP